LESSIESSLESQASDKVEQSPQNLQSSDYKTDLKYPDKVYSLEYVSQHLYDEPLWGIQLRYAHIFSSSDILDVYIYPIPAISWDDQMQIVREETSMVVKEIDVAVEKGQYKSANAGETVEIDFNGLKGVKTPVEILSQNEQIYNSFIYLFIKEDKFIKLRFSFLKGDGSGLPNEDVLARELVLGINVPAESSYMFAKRNEAKQRRALQLIQMLLDTSKNEKKEKSETSESE